MDYDVVFESERILFVKVTEKLVQDYLDMLTDNEVQKYISTNFSNYTYEGEIEWVNKKLANNDKVFSLIEKSTGDYIGNIEIMDPKDKKGELGIALVSSKHNNHFGQEAIKRIVEYAFNDLGLEEVELYVYNYNPRGIRCYEKVGFVMDGPGKTDDQFHMVIKK